MTGEWKAWVDEPPPNDEIVECRRVHDTKVKHKETRSFWVKPSLMPPAWNVGNVIWRPTANDSKGIMTDVR